MKRLFFLFFMLLSLSFSNAQIPKNGFYTYKIVYVESNGKLSGICKVLIKNNKITVSRPAAANASDIKYERVVEGIILKHQKSGKWIIGKNEKDKFAKEIGGCSDGPIEVDFKNKIIYLC
ncbi:hypothetical protein [Flavobacterium cheonanense]